MSLVPGTTVGGDFRIVSPLGRGGMGSVFVAMQLSTGMYRALKVMNDNMLANPVLRAKFAQEAHAVASIASDHVVQVVAAGIDQDLQLPWMAMELLTGETLSDLVESKGPQPLWALDGAFQQLFHALSAAHRSGIVHRDLKPENIFVASPKHVGAAFTIKVLDFGIAKVLADAHTMHEAQPRSRHQTAAMGSPAWMAPEQTNVRQAIDRRADVWPLGLLAFYVLTGKAFWRTARTADLDVQQVLREILIDPIDPPSARAAEFGAAHLLPPGFDDWFNGCVRRNPDERFASIELAAQAFHGMVHRSAESVAETTQCSPEATHLGHGAGSSIDFGRTVVAGGSVVIPSLPSQSAPPRVRRRRLPLWIPGIAVVVLLGGGAMVAWGMQARGGASAARCTEEAAKATAGNHTAALAVCSRACDAQVGSACLAHGDMLLRFGSGQTRQAGASYKVACEANVPSACSRYVQTLMAASGDAQVVADLLDKQCDQSDQRACAYLAAVTLTASERKEDVAKATSLFETACKQANDALGCAGRAFLPVPRAHGRANADSSASTTLEQAAAVSNALAADCEGGAAMECLAEGALQQRAGKTADARHRYEQACDRGSRLGCNNAGVLAMAAASGEADAKRGDEWLARACSQGESLACGNAAALRSGYPFVVQMGLRWDVQVRVACSGDVHLGCAAVGPVASSPWHSPAQKEAVVELERVCVSGLGLACVNAGAVACRGTRLTGCDVATKDFERACTAGHAAGCGALAEIHHHGIGVEVDRGKAAELRVKACKKNDVESCIQDGLLSGDSSVLKTQCEDSKVAFACLAYADTLTRGRGDSSADRVRARALFDDVASGRLDRSIAAGFVGLGRLASTERSSKTEEAERQFGRGCEDASAVGCAELSALVAKASPERAADAARRGCERGDGDSCVQQTALQLAGPAREGAAQRAVELCSAGFGSACAVAARAYEQGLGVVVDPKRARSLHEAACQRDVSASCAPTVAGVSRTTPRAAASAMAAAPSRPTDCGRYQSIARGCRALFNSGCSAAAIGWEAKSKGYEADDIDGIVAQCSPICTQARAGASDEELAATLKPACR